MSSSIRSLSLFLLTLLSAPILLRAQSLPPKRAPAKVSRGVVSGRVTIKDKPAAGVVVGLRRSLGSTPYLEPFKKATTDQDGNYRIADVAAGTYDVTASAPAFVIVDTLNNRAKNVIVGEDEEVEDINFSLVRGGVITGKITDAAGRPVIQQQVNLYRAGDFAQSPRQVYPITNAQTDDRGVYRFFGLVAGQYKVASGRAEGILGGVAFNASRLTYKQIFHPDTPDAAKATVVDVREGSEAGNVDISLGRAVQTFSASGRVIYGDTQLPAPNVRFAVQRFSADTFQGMEGVTVSNAQGDFFIDSLAPGRYSVFLYPNQNPELRVDSLMFDVVDQDVSMITIKLIKGLTVSGVVVFEHEDKKAFAKLLELQLRGQVSPPPGTFVTMQAASSPIAPDGSFRFVGLGPGNLNFWLSGQPNAPLPKGFAISRIEHNGVVVSQVPINDGEQVMGVRVFISYGTASIRGVVNVDRTLLPEGARMFARLVKHASGVNGLAQVLVDARGHFLMEGIPAGVYDLSVTLLATAPGMRPRSVSQQVTVQDGIASDVSLTLELADPKP